MAGQLFKLKANFKDISDSFLAVGEIFYKPADIEENKTQIDKDLHRQVYLSRGHTLDQMKANWLREDTHNSFTQGNMDGRVIGETFIKLKIMANEKLIEAGKQMDYFQSLKSCSFAYIDKDGNDCGFNITYLTEAPEIFTISLIKNTRSAPEYREITIFQGNDDNFFPSLNELAGDSYKDGSLINESDLKQQLMDYPALPDEVKYLFNDIINENGSINVEQANHYVTALKVNENNHDLKFGSEHAKDDLLIYQTFCISAIAQLKVADDLDAEKLSGNIKETLDKITSSLEDNQDTPQLGEKNIVNQRNLIQNKVIEHLKSGCISQPYKAALSTMQQKFEHANQSLVERRGTSLMTSTALTVLAAAAIALTATGVVAPIGIALAAAVSITVGLASLVSWGVTAYKEYKFSKTKSNLDSDLNKDIESLKQGGGNKETLKLYLDNPSFLGANSNSLFSKADTFKSFKDKMTNALKDNEEEYRPQF